MGASEQLPAPNRREAPLLRVSVRLLMSDTIIASTRFVGTDEGQMWTDDDVTYVLGHPDWFDLWNANPPQGRRLEPVVDVDLSANAVLRDQVFMSWRRWRADQAAN
jgi:hypothetical protein